MAAVTLGAPVAPDDPEMINGPSVTHMTLSQTPRAPPVNVQPVPPPPETGVVVSLPKTPTFMHGNRPVTAPSEFVMTTSSAGDAMIPRPPSDERRRAPFTGSTSSKTGSATSQASQDIETNEVAQQQRPGSVSVTQSDSGTDRNRDGGGGGASSTNGSVSTRSNLPRVAHGNRNVKVARVNPINHADTAALQHQAAVHSPSHAPVVRLVRGSQFRNKTPFQHGCPSCHQLNDMVKSLKSAVLDAKRSVNQARNDYKMLLTRVQQESNEMEDGKLRQKLTADSNAELKELLFAQETEISTTRGECDRLFKENTTMSESIDSMTAELDELRQRSTTLDKDLTDTRAAMAQAVQRADRMRASERRTQNKLKQCEEQLSKALNARQEADKRSSEAEKRMDKSERLQRVLSDKCERMSEAAAAAELVKQELTDALFQIETDKIEMAKVRSELHDAMHGMCSVEEAQRMQIESVRLRRDLLSASQMAKSKEMDMRGLTTQVEFLIEETKQLEADLKEANLAQEIVLAERDEARQQVNELRSKMLSDREELKLLPILRQQKVQLTAEVNNLNRKLTQTDAENAKLVERGTGYLERLTLQTRLMEATDSMKMDIFAPRVVINMQASNVEAVATMPTESIKNLLETEVLPKFVKVFSEDSTAGGAKKLMGSDIEGWMSAQIKSMQVAIESNLSDVFTTSVREKRTAMPDITKTKKKGALGKGKGSAAATPKTDS